MTYNYNDDELIYMIRENKSDDALNIMFKKYEPLFRKISQEFIKKNKYKGLDLDDLLQQCRLATYNALQKYDNDNETLFYTYLLVCVRRSLSHYIRNVKDTPDVFYYMDDEEKFSNTVGDGDISEDLDTFNFYSLIRDFSLELKFIDSCIFELKLNNFSYKEITTLLGINYKKVDNSLLKTRKKLEKFLEIAY